MPFKYSSKDINVDGGFTAPAGNYSLVFKNVKEKMTKNGDPMVSVFCEIDDNSYLGVPVWHNVTFLGPDEEGKPRRGAGMAIKFLKTIGEPWEGDFEVSPENCNGKKFQARLNVGKSFSGLNVNTIAYLHDGEESGEAAPF